MGWAQHHRSVWAPTSIDELEMEGEMEDESQGGIEKRNGVEGASRSNVDDHKE